MRKNKNLKSFTLIEVLVGTFLMLVVFSGIFGAYQLGLKVVGLSKNKITATAIASGQLELIRNLSYESVGTKGASLPYAVGVSDSSTTTIRNNIEYTTNIWVDYISDEADGSADLCNLDYKRAEVEVSWPGRFGGKVKLTTYVAPKNKTEEINTCITQPGGILSVSVFNAYGEMVNSPLIKIFNSETGTEIPPYSPPTGKHDFPLATSTYKVVVSKEGYGTEQTYGIEEIATPANPNPIVLVNQLTEVGFSIDKISNFSIDTFSPGGSDNFSDAFLDETKISQKSNVITNQGTVTLATSSGGYVPSGYLFSIEISPNNLTQWDKFSFSDSEPSNTDLKYQIYFASGTQWSLVPNNALSGNSTGFDASPVNLSDLSTTTYARLEIKGNFSSSAPSKTPSLYDWQISWFTNLPIPVHYVTFNLQGSKIIGYDDDEEPVYKYSATSTSDSSGHVDIIGLESDSYVFSIDPATDLDLIDTNPSPQPIDLAPDSTLAVSLYLESSDSLLLTLQDTETLGPIFAASVRMRKSSLGYDKTQYTDEKGQTYFIPLNQTSYTLDINAPGYLPFSTTVSVSGNSTIIIKLEQVE